MRLAIHVGLTGALMALPELVVPALRWLSTLGRQSLFAYIVTVELTYGARERPQEAALIPRDRHRHRR